MEMATMAPSDSNSEAKRAKQQEEEDDQDLISALPIHLLQHVLSLLPTKDAVRSSTLTTTWLHAWNTLPVSTFNFASDAAAQLEETSRLVAKFHNTLSILHQKEAMFVNLHVSWPSFRNDLYENCIHEWMRLVAGHRLRELDIDVLHENMDDEDEDEDEDEEVTYTLLHETVFAASESLALLRLRGCSMTMHSVQMESRNLVALRVLFWEDDFFDCQIVEELLNLCPVLEECTLISVYKGDSTLMLSDHRKLKQVKVDRFMKVVIENMPSLQVLDVSNFSFIEGGKYCNELSKLTLRTCEDTRYGSLQYFVYQPPSLESLVLHTGDDTPPITIRSPCIENFVFSSRTWPRENAVYAPRLRCYEYIGSVLPPISIEPNPSALERIELVLTPEKHGTYLFFKCLRRNLPKLTGYKSVLKLTIKANEFAPLPLPSNEGHLPPPARIDFVELQDIWSPLIYMSLIKWLIWCCRPLTLSGRASYIFLQVFRDIILHRLDDTKPCTDCCTCTCSRLRDVKVDTRYGIKDFKNINIDEYHELLSEKILKFRLEWL